MKKRIAIWDLDNCLANDGHRIQFIDWKTNDPDKRYAMYHNLCHLDAPGNTTLFDAACTMGFEPVFITGRPESVRAATQRWIKERLTAIGPLNLLMRPAGNRMGAVELKETLVKCAWLDDPELFVAAYDDHPDIVKMYRERFGFDAQQIKIHDLDAYRNEGELERDRQSPHKPVLTGPRQADAWPVQGARPVRDPGAVKIGCDVSINDLRGISWVKLADSAPTPLAIGAAPSSRRPASTILREMADTFDQRNAQYRDNSRMVPKLVQVLFPHGVPPNLPAQEEWHLFELILVKLTRFATSGLTHIDSIHDAAPYCAMIETILKEKKQ